MTTICILILAYCILGKDIKALLEKVKDVDWHSTINTVINKVRPWALKVGRTTARPILQFFGAGIYKDNNEAFSTLEKLAVIEPSDKEAYEAAYETWKSRLNN